MDQAAFEEYIADDVEEHRGELHVEQVTPRYGVARGAYLRILEIEPFEAVYDELSERVQQFLKVATSEQLDKERGDSGDVVEEAEESGA